MAEEREKQEELNGARATAEGMPETTEQAPADVDALKRQLEDAETKLAESLDGWQRSLADFQNYKKRVERDNEIVKANMKGDLIKKVQYPGASAKNRIPAIQARKEESLAGRDSMNQLKSNVHRLQEMQSRLEFMLNELEGLVKKG